MALAALAVGAALLWAAPGAASAAFVNGSAGLGDPYFPKAGNGGYEVSHYYLRLRYQPRPNRLRAMATVTAQATESLRRFDLDLRHLHVSRVTVDGGRARYRRRGQELVITPRKGLRKGTSFVVRVRYAGHPRPVIDPDGSNDGWTPTGDGAFVASEPQGSPSWFPCNDYPTDKATYGFKVTVPNGITAVANGTLTKRTVGEHRTTFVWNERSPMATYLATVTSGKFDVRTSQADGIPSYVAVDPREAAKAQAPIAKIPAILDLLQRRFGAYPFGETGAIVDHAPSVGYALETQSRPLYDTAPSDATVAHELSHQWFGDSVSIRRWRQIWLNEGFATWSQWLWQQKQGDKTTRQRFNDLYKSHGRDDKGFWNPPPGNPGGAKYLFDGSIYERGGMTLEALREKLGQAAFSRILRDWVRQHAYGNASIKEFIALVEKDTQRNLHHFFHVWLYKQGKPRNW